MTRINISKSDAKKIVNLLYPSLANETRRALPELRNKLLEKKGFNSSFVKDPISSAPSHLNQPVLSNVLRFSTSNQLLTKTDFSKLIPKDYSHFDWSSETSDDRHFQVVQGRDAELISKGCYYLIFKDIEHAAAFKIDVQGKKLNGSSVDLEMIQLQQHLEHITNPLLQETTQIRDNILSINREKSRKNYVLVKGIPTFIQKPVLKELFWDYDFDFSTDSMLRIKHDQISKVAMWLLSFENPLESLRFVRTFNGQRFNNEQNMSKIYASILS